MIRHVAALLALTACAEPRIQERIAGGLDAAAMVVDLAAVEVQADACAGLTATAAALRGAADGVRYRDLPAVSLDLRRCGELEPAKVACEVEAWTPAATLWLSGLASAALDAAQDPSTPVTVPAVAVEACP